MNSEKKNTTNPSTFEEDLSTLESIVNALEEGKLPLDEALRKFEKGIALVRKCEKTLREAERKVEMLMRGMNGELQAVPFDEEGALSNSDDEPSDRNSNGAQNYPKATTIPPQKKRRNADSKKESPSEGRLPASDDEDFGHEELF